MRMAVLVDATRAVEETAPVAVRSPAPQPPGDAGALVALPPRPADQHPAFVYLSRLGPGSRATMRRALDTIAAFITTSRYDAGMLDWSRLRYQHTQAVRTALAERYKPATANKHLAALRGVLREAWRLGQMEAEAYHRAVDLAGIKATTLPRGRALPAGELRALFRACRADTRPTGTRDAALLALLYGAGLRRSEVTALDIANYDLETGALTVRASKGRKDRLTYAPTGTRAALNAWVKLRGTQPGPLFWPSNPCRHLVNKRMVPQSVFDIVRQRAAEAGAQMFSPHDLRRTFIGDLLDNGADLATVQALAGHANVQTTVRYDRRGEATKRRAAELLHVPIEG